MKSLKAPSRSIAPNNFKSIKGNSNVALSIIDMSARSSIDGLHDNLFETLGIESHGFYSVGDLINILNGKNIDIVSVKGYQFPSELEPNFRDVFFRNEFSSKIFSNIFSSDLSPENYMRIMESIGEEYEIITARIFPTFSEFNKMIDLKETYIVKIYGRLKGTSDLSEMNNIISVRLS